MGNQNSLVGFYADVLLHLHSDVAGAYASTSDVEYLRDRREIANRVSTEGLGFLTKTLPRLGKALDRALSSGERLQCSGFKLKSGTQLPRFLWTLFKRVFDDTGRERSDACPLVLGQLRQLLFVLYKLKLPYDENTANHTIRTFVEIDENLDYDPIQFNDDERSILHSARNLVCRIMSGLCAREIFPKHGPGSVATGERAHKKRTFSRLNASIESEYPFTEYFRFNLTHVTDSLDELAALTPVESGTAKVVLVQKDSRGPRIISCEPLENQWIQQGQMAAIVQHLESHSLTRGHVNFTDQFVNRKLAMSSSYDGRLCTLDMKEASDRVSLDLVQHLFPKNWFEALYASRSDSTKLPDGTIVPLNKFAPMGSAVCFPVEALVFWALCVSVVMHTRKVSLAQARRDLYVYGDDIICSSADQAAIRQYLPRFGLKLNEDKCCTGRFFRESCGCDAYKGIDVTPLRISAVWCHRLEASTYDSYVAYSNAAFVRGYYALAQFLEDRIQKIRRTPYTNGSLPQGISFVRDHVTARLANRVASIKTRFNKTKSRWEAYGWRSQPSYIKTATTGWDELLRVTSTQRWGINDPPPELSLAEQAQRTEEASRDAFRRGKTLDKVVDPLRSSKQVMRAGLYTVPHSNRLQRGWIAVV